MTISSQLLLRLGLGFVFLYAGTASFLNPQDWIGYVPVWVENFGISQEVALYAHAAGDITLGLWMLSGLLRRWAGIAAFGWLASIIVVTGFSNFLVTFRDVGLALCALAYGMLPTNKE